ncbi:type IX secretion/gliding motility protein PorT/SprT [Fibrivirga algicola]|uniref:PorT family protein n=1 Tax=Fibrivirga algicola TaxID=2950420 RepID=A0ABX0Q9S6_9BACT|nr:outer membrane beta-barrel protein [Fibrivirga algicola]NID08921.1 PorT family protein [Fibrivirga algicola]
MDSTLVRHRVDLHWSKAVRSHAAIVVILLLFAQVAAAQSTYKYTRKHKEDYDDKLVHFGFYYALPFTRYNITYSPAFLNTADSTLRITSPNNAGFRVGFTFNAFLNDNFDFRSNPGVSIYSRSVNYAMASGNEKSDVRESTWIELPFLIKYKSARRANSRMYLIAGASLGIETNVRRREAISQGRLNTSTTDLSVEYGVGFEQFFEFFKFAPELRFSHGIPNAFNGGTGSSSSQGIKRLTSHNVTLYLNFE